MIDHSSFIPLYHQLAHILREKIYKSKLLIGQMLPSERKLMEEYSLSRNTVRQAMELLVKEGLIFRKHGHGTYVSHLSNKYHYMMDTFYENRDLLIRAGHTPTVEFISTEEVFPPKVVTNALGLGNDEKTLCHTMIFSADKRKAMYTKDYLPLQLAGKYDLSNEGDGFINYLDSVSGTRVEYVLIDISSEVANDEIAHGLGCQSGSPILLMKETFLDGTQTVPISFSLNYFNQEIINFKLLTRRG